MAIRSSHLVGPFALSSGDNEVLLVPEDHVYLIKSLWLHNTSGSARTVTLLLNDSDATHRVWRQSMAAAENVILTAWWVLNTFEELIINSSGTGPIVSIYGTDLVQPVVP